MDMGKCLLCTLLVLFPNVLSFYSDCCDGSPPMLYMAQEFTSLEPTKL